MPNVSIEDELAGARVRIAELEGAEQRARDAQAELVRAHRLYRAAVDSAPIGLGVSDSDGDLLLWNDAMLAVSGFAPSEVERWKAVRASEASRRERQRGLEVIRSRGGMEPTVIPIQRPDGETSAALVTAKPLQIDGADYLHVTMQDVTELKRFEHALRESELRFRQVAETIRQVFYLANEDISEILYISPAYEEQWGRTCQSLYENPRSWTDAIHPDDRPRVLEHLARGSVDGRRTFEYRIVRPDGSIRSISDSAFELLDANGKVYRVVGVADDITDRKRLEEQLRESQKLDAIGQLAGGVAHDFNNLLTSILGNVEILSKSLPAEGPHSQPFGDIVLAANRAAGLTRKLLGFSRRAVLSLEPLDLRFTVRETAALLRHTLDPRVELVTEEPDELVFVKADAGEMSQVVLNLCLNGRDSMPDGGRLLLRTEACLLSEEDARRSIDARPGEVVRLTVEDSGHGIPAEARGRIFEPFFTTKQPGAGTGLGLAMVFGIVKQHRGWVEFTSEVGRGTRFEVYLPRSHDVPKAEVVAQPPPAPVTPRETILFVDDEAPLRRLATTILSRRGYRVLVAEDGLSALEIFEREWGSIDLIILDLRMPRMSGRDTLHAIWRVHPGARVLVSTGHAGDHERVAEAEPIAGSLHKPYGVEDLARAVRTALGAARRSLH